MIGGIQRYTTADYMYFSSLKRTPGSNTSQKMYNMGWAAGQARSAEARRDPNGKVITLIPNVQVELEKATNGAWGNNDMRKRNPPTCNSTSIYCTAACNSWCNTDEIACVEPPLSSTPSVCFYGLSPLQGCLEACVSKCNFTQSSCSTDECQVVYAGSCVTRYRPINTNTLTLTLT